MDISADESGSGTPEEIINKAKEVTLNLLPDKSKQRYNIQYNLFMEWCASKKVKKYSESVILAYLSELSEKYKSSTLWSIYSMLKTTLLIKNDINIGEYKKVTSFLKKKSVGYVAKKSEIFSALDINRFLREAPDEIYLMTKVVLIVGIAGACRTDELTNLTVDNLQDKDDILIIHIPDTKNYKQRTFTICNSNAKENKVDIVSICQRYFNLRPKHMNSRRLFVKYQMGKCVAQNVSYHTIGSVPSKIAAYLNLPNIRDYTGHCLRRSSATLLADSFADILTLKRHGGWKSTSVTEGYVEESLENKISVAKKILNTSQNTSETSMKIKESLVSLIEPQEITDVSNLAGHSISHQQITDVSNLAEHGISFDHCTINNPVFNFNYSNN